MPREIRDFTTEDATARRAALTRPRHYRPDDTPPTNVLPLDRFTQGGADTIVADVSDLGSVVHGTPWIVRLFRDACDEGIFIRSPRTRNVVRFVLTNREVDEGDLILYEFAVYGPDRAYAGPVENVHIFND